MKTDSGKKRIVLFVVFTALLLLTVGASMMVGRYPVSVSDFFHVLFGNGTGETQENLSVILFRVRLPRILLAVLAGASLSAAGAAYQGVFQNAMASPDILGASSGAAFGAALAIVCHLPSAMITLSAFLFSVLTVFLSWFISERGHGKKVLLLILAGMMVSSLFNAGTSLLKLVADPESELQEITYWLMGSFSGADLADAAGMILPVLLGLIPLYLIRWRINLLTLGDEEARSLGVDVGKTRILVILCSTLMTAATVAAAGMIGWVGLLMPHLCRKLFGNNYRTLLPASMLLGGIFLLLTDDLSRTLFAVEIPIGILTSLLGAPFFLILLTRRGDSV